MRRGLSCLLIAVSPLFHRASPVSSGAGCVGWLTAYQLPRVEKNARDDLRPPVDVQRARGAAGRAADDALAARSLLARSQVWELGPCEDTQVKAREEETGPDTQNCTP